MPPSAPPDPLPVFVYGTLRLEVVQRRVTGRGFAQQPASVADFEVRRVVGASYPVLWRVPGARAEGSLLLDVDAADLARLDRYEGALYRRAAVAVESAAGVRRAWAWLLAPGREPKVAPDTWSLPRFVAEDLPAFLQSLSS